MFKTFVLAGFVGLCGVAPAWAASNISGTGNAVQSISERAEILPPGTQNPAPDATDKQAAPTVATAPPRRLWMP